MADGLFVQAILAFFSFAIMTTWSNTVYINFFIWMITIQAMFFGYQIPRCLNKLFPTLLVPFLPASVKVYLQSESGGMAVSGDTSVVKRVKDEDIEATSKRDD